MDQVVDRFGQLLDGRVSSANPVLRQYVVIDAGSLMGIRLNLRLFRGECFQLNLVLLIDVLENLLMRLVEIDKLVLLC